VQRCSWYESVFRYDARGATQSNAVRRCLYPSHGSNCQSVQTLENNSGKQYIVYVFFNQLPHVRQHYASLFWFIIIIHFCFNFENVSRQLYKCISYVCLIYIRSEIGDEILTLWYRTHGSNIHWYMNIRIIVPDTDLQRAKIVNI